MPCYNSLEGSGKLYANSVKLLVVIMFSEVGMSAICHAVKGFGMSSFFRLIEIEFI